MAFPVLFLLRQKRSICELETLRIYLSMFGEGVVIFFRTEIMILSKAIAVLAACPNKRSPRGDRCISRCHTSGRRKKNRRILNVLKCGCCLEQCKWRNATSGED